MCNLSIGYYNEGFNEGQQVGADSAIVDMIGNYAINKGITIEQAMIDHSIPKDKWNYYASKCEMKYGKLN